MEPLRKFQYKTIINLTTNLITKSLSPNNQFGFRKGYSKSRLLIQIHLRITDLEVLDREKCSAETELESLERLFR